MNKIPANKSPKPTPTRTDFTSKAAAARLSSPLEICFRGIARFFKLSRSGSVGKYKLLKLLPFLFCRSDKLLGFFSSVFPALR